MRRLAQELGSGAASLYWHVGDKEELLSLLLDRIVGEAELPGARPGALAGAVKELGRAARGSCCVAPRRRRSSRLGRVPAGPNSLPILERNLAVLAASALPPQRDRLRRRHVRPLRRRASPTRRACACPRSAPRGELSGDYFASLPPEDFPMLTRLADDLTAGDADERFEFALELLVRGLEAMGSGERGGHDGG